MIIRERENDYIMIEQADHSKIAGVFAENWRDDLFRGAQSRKSVEYAIANHDIGWHQTDEMPFWDDLNNMPYDFLSYPVAPKLVFYKNGIDEVAQNDSYAGLLCSRHYVHLSMGDMDEADTRVFVKMEQERQDALKLGLKDFDADLFDFHYMLLSLCDNLSLYLCLNELGAPKTFEHKFFKDGIVIPTFQDFFKTDMLHIEWKNIAVVEITPFPLKNDVIMQLKQKTVKKKDIESYGLIDSYKNANLEQIDILIKANK